MNAPRTSPYRVPDHSTYEHPSVLYPNLQFSSIVVLPEGLKMCALREEKISLSFPAKKKY